MKDRKIPRIGMRNIKTALAVCCCLLLYAALDWSAGKMPQIDHPLYQAFLFLISRETPIFACVAAVISIQSTLEKSVNIGKNRVIGTIIGCLLGLAFLWLDNTILERKLNILMIVLGLSLLIYICTVAKLKEAVVISCVTYLIIMISVGQEDPYFYAMNRTIDTAVGVVVAVLVNKYVRLPHWKQKEEEEKEQRLKECREELLAQMEDEAVEQELISEPMGPKTEPPFEKEENKNLPE